MNAILYLCISAGHRVILIVKRRFPCVKKHHRETIDKEFAAMATKFEMAIVFGLIAPYILFIISIAIISNYYAYWFVESKLKWKVSNFSNKDNPNSINFPVYSILFSILLEQILITMFCWNLFDQIIEGAMIAVLAILDCAFLAHLWCKDRHINAEEHNSELVLNVRQSSIELETSLTAQEH